MKSLMLALLLLVPTVADSAGLKLYLAYAYEWNYRGAVNGESDFAARVIDKTPLVKAFDAGPHRLDLGVLNDEATVFRTRVELIVRLPEHLRVRAEGHWETITPHRVYRFHFVDLAPGQGLHPDGALFVTFPRPGLYPVAYQLRAADRPWTLKAFLVQLQ